MQNSKQIAINAIEKKVNSVMAIFSNISNEITHISFTLNCGLLPEPEFRKKDGRYVAPMSAEIFKAVTDNVNPCVYYFEFNPEDRNKIISSYELFEEEQKNKVNNERRASPAKKIVYPTNTNILYVGKSKGRNIGRLIVHLGYYDKGSTGGLQLLFWAKEHNIELTYHAFYFPLEMRDFVDPIEVALARSLNPLLGKL